MDQPAKTLTLHIEGIATGRWSYELRVNGQPHCGGVRDSFDSVITAARNTLKYYAPAPRAGASAHAEQVAA
jgi:hypothetical protein